jgi:hypothetical protein
MVALDGNPASFLLRQRLDPSTPPRKEEALLPTVQRIMNERLQELLEAHGLTEDTLLYRETLSEFLSDTPYPGMYSLSANDDPTEAVIDVYGGGHVSLAAQIGQGLGFAENSENQWQTEDRVKVAVRLGDVFAQGGLIYPVESVITEKIWYLTIPEGQLIVRKV